MPEATRREGMMEKCQNSPNCDSTYDLLNVNPDGLVVLLCALCRMETRWPTAQGGGARLEVVK